MKFEINYGLGGGFGGETEKQIFIADDNDEAEELGRLIAVEYAENFEGRYGIPSINDYASKQITDEDERYQAWVEMMDDMWIVYTIKLIGDD